MGVQNCLRGSVINVSIPGLYPHPYVREGGGEYQRIAWVNGQECAIVLDSAVTGGQLSVMDVHTRRGDASPVHVHHRDDEVFFLVDGAMTAWVGDQKYQLRPGGVCFLPRNIPHAIRFDTASRVMMLNIPAGPQEELFRELGWDLREPLPEDWRLSLDAVRDAAQRGGIELIGPPHGLED
jgi:quercetin dioxygenase-like cupin family protein